MSAPRPSRARVTLRSGRGALGAGRAAAEEVRRRARREPQRFGHPVVQQRRGGREVDGGGRSGEAQAVARAALDAAHARKTANMRDVGRLARPRRYGTEARRDRERALAVRSAVPLRRRARAVGEQALEQRALGLVERGVDVDEMHPFGRDRHDARITRTQLVAQPVQAELRQRGRAG